jgi:hypothetical protein
MRIAGPRAAEQADHRSIEDMFRRMHRRILLLVMGIENRTFHKQKYDANLIISLNLSNKGPFHISQFADN